VRWSTINPGHSIAQRGRDMDRLVATPVIALVVICSACSSSGGSTGGRAESTAEASNRPSVSKPVKMTPTRLSSLLQCPQPLGGGYRDPQYPGTVTYNCEQHGSDPDAASFKLIKLLSFSSQGAQDVFVHAQEQVSLAPGTPNVPHLVVGSGWGVTGVDPAVIVKAINLGGEEVAP
jgi:hypothetical protein